MKIIVAESAGFCYGVSRAVNICLEAAKKHKNCVTLGPIIHNEYVIRDLEANGVHAVSGLSEITEQNTVIIRSHGAGRGVHEALSALDVTIIDATCPDVKKIHDIVFTESAEGRFIVIVGHRHHPEIEAIAGWCREYIVFETPDELQKWLGIKDNAKLPASFVFQTTNTRLIFNTCAELIKKECTNHRIFDTMCGATLKRQQEAEEISKVSDVVIVAGDKNSANSLNLADICKGHCKNVLFVQNASDIDLSSVKSADVVGITAGASTPAFIIKEVTRKMKEETTMDGTPVEQEVSEALPEPEVTPEAEVEPEVTPEAEVEPEATPEEIAAPVEQAEEVPEITAEDPASEPVGKPADEPVEKSEENADDTEDNDDSDDDSMETESFEEMLEKSIKTLRTGEKVTGIVTSITSTEVSLDLGTKQSGYIPITEFTDNEHTDINELIKIGDTIESFVMRVNDVEGMVMLSKKRLDAIKNWDIVEAARENKTIVDGIVAEENKGGVVVNVKGVRVFVPASQTGLPKSAPMTDLLKKPVKLRITEVNQSRRRVVGSIRMVQNDERREKSDQVWTDIEVGKQYDGVVKSMTTYGVFVDIGGVDGMIHISELSWTRIKQPSEVMSVGDEVTVHILSFDKETRKISLGYKKSEDNPWTRFTNNFSVGDVVSVKIVKMMPFGAFAEISPGVDGLIHISQITDRRIGLPSEVLSDGQIVDVKITEIDNDRKKVSLSIRALIEPSSQSLPDDAGASSNADDNTPVVVYDTDSPPPMDDDEEDEE
ncbi:MAG: bifunctional 4-hydroxy-3-methylbut-2-enyl diphosphate reductase/30S ribosomal protein S1 [Oscillospiraceae bacterium]|nr:bifunctional 4-hydroxy-3-methylbut-2-enyl diphosphate reductase/30S ribosomal protein S1 [Oscillospiraceae bacterium]